MTVTVSRCHHMLNQASGALGQAVFECGLEPSIEVRLRLLEGVASWIGGYELAGYDRVVGPRPIERSLPADVTKLLTRRISEALEDGALPGSLALAALGDFGSELVIRRREGKYFTDPRLALEVVEGLKEQVLSAEAILDPSCGAGVFLVAAALQVDEGSGCRSHLVRDVLWGVDRNSDALGVAFAAVCSLTSDLDAVAKAAERFKSVDSLDAGFGWWRTLRPLGYDLVVSQARNDSQALVLFLIEAKQVACLWLTGYLQIKFD